MKKAYVLLLVLLLILAGCAGKEKTDEISVQDVCCPYAINHTNSGVEITLQDARNSGIHWNVEMIPEDICEVTQEDVKKENFWQYQISGKLEGAAQLTFTALQEDETISFVLTLIVNVDSEGKATVSSYQHRERESASVESNGLNYKWNVDVEGMLHFSFINDQDHWYVQGDGEGVFTLLNAMSTPVGCKFSARASGAGEMTVVLVGEATRRMINVSLQADDNGGLQVVSVQEQ